MHLKCWIRIRIQLIRIHNTALTSCYNSLNAGVLDSDQRPDPDLGHNILQLLQF
jgi:hypothetical protein